MATGMAPKYVVELEVECITIQEISLYNNQWEK